MRSVGLLVAWLPATVNNRQLAPDREGVVVRCERQVGKRSAEGGLPSIRYEGVLMTNASFDGIDRLSRQRLSTAFTPAKKP